MTKQTHKGGGMLVSIVGFWLLLRHGLLIKDVALWIQWLVMYPFAIWGSTASDLDHHWQSCPSKDYPSRIINKLLHITAPLEKSMKSMGNTKSTTYKVACFLNAKHRSWQTHSDLTIYVMLYVLNLVVNGKLLFLNRTEAIIVSLVLTGLSLGVIAHLILDVLTPQGILLVGIAIINRVLKINLPERLRLVPSSSFFATGHSWESFINKLLSIATWVALALFLLYMIFPDWTSYLSITFG